MKHGWRFEMGYVGEFFRGVAREMRKTSWPKRKELVKMTITVIITVLIVAVFFIAVDAGITTVIREIL